uniref:Uncharacterized protein n=1 Tax=Nelumbo nucifera TaxID=4432 RepID=A0A822YG35_NELNU|nr:TPA_asm: hypothetical protein HUJ06_031413 [Nelumbo nucifera]
MAANASPTVMPKEIKVLSRLLAHDRTPTRTILFGRGLDFNPLLHPDVGKAE